MTIKLIRDETGTAHVFALMLILLSFMLLAVGLVVGSIISKHGIVKQSLQRAIVSCAVQNLDRDYSNMIEAESFTDAVDYNTAFGKSPFYTALEGNFAHFSKTETGDYTSYEVYSKGGGISFEMQNLQMDLSVVDATLAGTKEKRLLYTASCSLRIPYTAFGTTWYTTIPVRVTATYQCTA